MYGMNYSGGNNKTHGQIEVTGRIDSFEAGKRESCGLLMAARDGQSFPLRYARCTLYVPKEQEVVELSYPGSQWRNTLKLTRVPSGFGGSRAFWLCPLCGGRARFLYFKGQRFVCRECAKLNYRSQQRTRDSANHYWDGLKLARDKLGWEPPEYTCPMDFPYLTPPCPRYMRQSAYQRYLTRFRRYQAAYQRDSLREMLAILHWRPPNES